MMEAMRRLRSAALSGLFFCFSIAVAQAQQSFPVTQSGTRNDAATLGQSSTPAVNAQTTLTLPICTISTQFIYLTMWAGAACENGVASATAIQQNWTSTNMPALGAQTSVISGSTITTNPGVALCDRFNYTFPTGYKASAAGAVTLVSPAANANVSYPQIATYYCAP